MPEHSLVRHPLRELTDFERIRSDVQFCRISWPIGVEIREPDEDAERANMKVVMAEMRKRPIGRQDEL